MRLYAQYGQTNGLSGSLDLSALVCGFDIEAVPQTDRADLTRIIQKVHSVRMEVEERRRAMARQAKPRG